MTDQFELKIQKLRKKEEEKLRTAAAKKEEADRKKEEAAREKDKQRKKQVDIKFTAGICNKALSKTGAIKAKMEKALIDDMVKTNQVPKHVVKEATTSFDNIKKINKIATDHVGGEPLNQTEKQFLLDVDDMVKAADSACKALQEMNSACRKHVKAMTPS